MGAGSSQPAHTGTPRSPAGVQRRDVPSPQELAEETSALWALPLEERYRKLEDSYEIDASVTPALGKGHYGVVRRGRRLVDGTAVAIKTVRKRQPLYVDMLRNEITILRGLKHPNVISLIDTFETPVDVHLVFELCAGELFEPIADSGFRFTEPQVARLIQALLSALQECKRQHIVHRDIKPENILLMTPGVESSPRLIDFGLASRLEPGGTLTRHVGTPYYCAPEVLQQRGYTEQCDVWSLGVVTFTMLCGYPPFWGDTERDIYRRIKRGTYGFEGPEWEVRSQAALDFVSRVLVGDPQRRLTVEDALLHPWITHEGAAPDLEASSLFHSLARHAARPALWRLVALALAECALRQDWLPQLRYAFDDEDEEDDDSAGDSEEEGSSEEEDGCSGGGNARAPDSGRTGGSSARASTALTPAAYTGDASRSGSEAAAAGGAASGSTGGSGRARGRSRLAAAVLHALGKSKKTQQQQQREQPQRGRSSQRRSVQRTPRTTPDPLASLPRGAAVPPNISSLLTDYAVRAFEVLAAHTGAATRAAAQLASVASDRMSRDSSSSGPSVSFAALPEQSKRALRAQSSSISDASSTTAGSSGFSSSTGSWGQQKAGSSALGSYRITEASFCAAEWTSSYASAGGKDSTAPSAAATGAKTPSTATIAPSPLPAPSSAPSSSPSSSSSPPFSPPALSTIDAQLVFRAVDVAGSGSLGIVEVVAALLPLPLVRRYPNVIVRAFDRLDADGDGLLSTSDLCSVCHPMRRKKRFTRPSSSRDSSSSRSRSRSSSRGSSVASYRSGVGSGGSGEVGPTPAGTGQAAQGVNTISVGAGATTSTGKRGGSKQTASDASGARAGRRSPSPPSSRGKSNRGRSRSRAVRVPPVVTLALHESDADGDGALTLADVMVLV